MVSGVLQQLNCNQVLVVSALITAVNQRRLERHQINAIVTLVAINSETAVQVSGMFAVVKIIAARNTLMVVSAMLRAQI